MPRLRLVAVTIPLLAVLSLRPLPAAAQSPGSPSSLDPRPFSAEMPPPPTSSKKSADSDDHGFDVSLRVGFGRAFGSTSSESGGIGLGDALDGFLPVSLTAGYRAVPWVTLAFTGSLGPLFLANQPLGACDQAASRSCSGWGAGLSFEAQVHTRPDQRIDPFIGLGFGYEWLHIDTKDPLAGPGLGHSGSSEFGGMHYVEAVLGLDVQVARGLALGPFLGFTLGRYSSVTVTDESGLQTYYLFKQPAFHEWLTAGISSRFRF